MDITWREQLAGAAWFFDGEGYCGVHTPKGSRSLRIIIGISQNDRWVLDRFRDAVGMGGAYGPYGETNPKFYYNLQGYERVQYVVALMWKFLGPIKRAQAARALLRVRAEPSYVHVCRRGHARVPGVRVCRQCNAALQADFRERHRDRLQVAARSEAHRAYHRNYQRHARLVEKTARFLLSA